MTLAPCPIRIRRRQASTLLDDRDIPPLLARLYGQRGVSDPRELDYSLARLPDWRGLKGIEAAVGLLRDAIGNDRHILIVADFDADGATSCALAVRGLKAMGATRVSYVVPNRFEYGYGLTPEIVDVAAARLPDLIVTVDNGISSIDGVAHARELGIEVLVTDHHLPGASLPAASAIVNPNQPGDGFPCKHLAGVGVMFYVLSALRAGLRERDWFGARGLVEPRLADLLDLVALGTVADVVPLDHTNRILVEQGLRRIRAGRAVAGIGALIEVAGRNRRTLSASDIGFGLGPRLNAAGRLDDMSLGIECLLGDAADEVLEMARELDRLNRERQGIEGEMHAQAVEDLEHRLPGDGELPYGLALFDETWHQGVVGILASRLKERLHRPVIAFARGDGGELKGSARSIPGVHIRDVLDRIASRTPGLISRFGGHAMAAGMTLPEAHLADFSAAFDAVLRELLTEEDLRGVILSDGELADSELNLQTARLLRAAGPWGQAFPEPLFDGEFELLDRRIVGQRHLRLRLKAPGCGQVLEAIAFNTTDADWPGDVQRLHLAYRLDVNEYAGRITAQLVVQHLQALPGRL